MFPARLSELHALRSFVEGFCAQARLARDKCLRLNLVLEELFTNTVRHGHRGDCEFPVWVSLAADGDALVNDVLGYEHETLVLGRDEIAPAAVGVIVLVDSHRHGAPATLELLPALTRSCARRPFNGTCKHDTAVLLEERPSARPGFVKGAS